MHVISDDRRTELSIQRPEPAADARPLRIRPVARPGPPRLGLRHMPDSHRRAVRIIVRHEQHQPLIRLMADRDTRSTERPWRQYGRRRTDRRTPPRRRPHPSEPPDPPAPQDPRPNAAPRHAHCPLSPPRLKRDPYLAATLACDVCPAERRPCPLRREHLFGEWMTVQVREMLARRGMRGPVRRGPPRPGRGRPSQADIHAYLERRRPASGAARHCAVLRLGEPAGLDRLAGRAGIVQFLNAPSRPTRST